MWYKKWMSLLLVLAMTLGLVACGSEAKEEKKAADVQASLYEHGLDIIELMVEVSRSEEYVELYVSYEPIWDVIKEIGEGDFEEPKKVYAVTASVDAMAEYMDIMDMADVEDLSVGLEQNLKNKMFGNLITQINARQGDNVLVVSSVCSIGKTFVEDIDDNVIYIYIYKDAIPVAVTFIKGEDDSVSATGNFLMYEDFIEAPEELLDYLENLGLEVEEVDIP